MRSWCKVGNRSEVGWRVTHPPTRLSAMPYCQGTITAVSHTSQMISVVLGGAPQSGCSGALVGSYRVSAPRETGHARSPVADQPEHRSEVVAYDQAESRRRIRVVFSSMNIPLRYRMPPRTFRPTSLWKSPKSIRLSAPFRSKFWCKKLNPGPTPTYADQRPCREEIGSL